MSDPVGARSADSPISFEMKPREIVEGSDKAKITVTAKIDGVDYQITVGFPKTMTDDQVKNLLASVGKQLRALASTFKEFNEGGPSVASLMRYKLNTSGESKVELQSLPRPDAPSVRRVVTEFADPEQKRIAKALNEAMMAALGTSRGEGKVKVELSQLNASTSHVESQDRRIRHPEESAILDLDKRTNFEDE